MISEKRGRRFLKKTPKEFLLPLQGGCVIGGNQTVFCPQIPEIVKIR